MMRPRYPMPRTGVSLSAANRPDTKTRFPNGVMFSAEGSTGWGRIRNLGDYEQGRSEHDFANQYDRFTEEEA